MDPKRALGGCKTHDPLGKKKIPMHQGRNNKKKTTEAPKEANPLVPQKSVREVSATVMDQSPEV